MKIDLIGVLRFLNLNQIGQFANSIIDADSDLIDEVVNNLSSSSSEYLVRNTFEFIKNLNIKSEKKFSENNIKNICKLCNSIIEHQSKYKYSYEKTFAKYLPGIIRNASISDELFIEYYEILKNYKTSLRISNPELFKMDEVKLLYEIQNKKTSFHYETNYYKSFKNLTPDVVKENINIVNWNHIIQNCIEKETEMPKEYLDLITTFNGFKDYVPYAKKETIEYLFKRYKDSKIALLGGVSNYYVSSNLRLKLITTLTDDDYRNAPGDALFSFISLADVYYVYNVEEKKNLKQFSYIDSVAKQLIVSKKIKDPSITTLNYKDVLFTNIILSAMTSEKYKEYLKVLKTKYLDRPEILNSHSHYSSIELPKYPEIMKYFKDIPKKNSQDRLLNEISLFCPDFLREEIFNKMQEKLNSLTIK